MFNGICYGAFLDAGKRVELAAFAQQLVSLGPSKVGREPFRTKVVRLGEVQRFLATGNEYVRMVFQLRAKRRGPTLAKSGNQEVQFHRSHLRRLGG